MTKVGRPQFNGREAEVITLLAYAFSMGCTAREACLHASISEKTYYAYIDKYPEKGDRFRALRDEPVLKARRNIDEALTRGDPEVSKWYLERKRKKEFSTRSELAGDPDDPIQFKIIHYGDKGKERLPQKAGVQENKEQPHRLDQGGEAQAEPSGETDLINQLKHESNNTT